MATTAALYAQVVSTFPDSSSPAPLPNPKPLSSYWLDNYASPLATRGSDAPFPDEVDIVIIGAGLTGVNCLKHLVQKLSETDGKGFRIAILEARTFCSGATGRNGGHLIPSAELAFLSTSRSFSRSEAIRSVLLERRAVDSTLDLIESQGWEDDVDLVRGGNIHFFRREAEIESERKELEAARKAGIDLSGFEFMEAAEATKRYGATNVVGALRIPGNNLYPLKLVTKVFQHSETEAKKKDISVDLFTVTPVESVDQAGTGSWNVKTSRGTIKSRIVVHCTNAYVSHLLPHYSSGSLSIAPTRGQAVSVRPLSTSSPNPLWTCGLSANEGFDYLFQRPAVTSSERKGEEQPVVIFGGGRNVAAPKYEFGEADDAKLNAEVSKHLRSFLPNWFGRHWSREKDVHVEQEWSGIMAFTKDHDPVVGPAQGADGKELAGQFVSAGYSGHGVSRAPACGEALADMIVAHLREKEWTPPDWFPLHYLPAHRAALHV